MINILFRALCRLAELADRRFERIIYLEVQECAQLLKIAQLERENRLLKQEVDALKDVNRYYAAKANSRYMPDSEAVMYYIESGAAKEFARREEEAKRRRGFAAIL